MSDDFRSLFGDDEPEEKKPPDDTPEWLRDVPVPGDQRDEEKRPDSLGFTGELEWRQELGDPFAALDAEQGDETPDWQTEQPASTEGEAGQHSGLTGELGWMQGGEDEQAAPESGGEELLDWMAEDTPEEEADSDWVEPAEDMERPSARDYDLPPWLMGADDAEDQGMFLDETGKLSEAWLKSGDELPETHEADMTYDEWMAKKAEEQRPRDLEEEVPDLPTDAEPAGSAPGTGEVPDWYLGMETLDTSEAPDWFRDEEMPATPAETPDLFSELDFQQPAAAEEEVLPEVNLEQAMETPDWMAEMGGADLSDEFALEQSIASAPGEAEAPEEEELPDWLGELGSGLELEEALEESMVDDVLAGLDLGAPGERQDWFAEAEPAAPSSDVPDWLQQLGDMSTAETMVQGTEAGVTPGDADFLAELQAASGTGGLPDLEAPAFQDIDSLLASMDSGATLPDTGELLLDPNPDLEDVFAENALGMADQAPPRPDTGLSPDAPDWLTELGATVGQVSAAAIVRQRKDRPLEDLSARLQHLHDRGEELSVPDIDDEEELNTLATLLPGVPQVLAPARLRPGLPSLPPDVLLTDAQRERVKLLKSLVAAEEDVQRSSAIERTYDSPYMEGLLEDEEVAPAPAIEGAPAPAPKPRRKPRRRFNVERFIISLLVAAGVILPFYFNQLRVGSLPPAGFAAGSSQQTAFNQMDALQSGDLVLVAVEYGPTGAAELDSLTDALLRHIFTRGARPVLVSGNPVGLLHANNVLDSINQDNFFFGRINRSQDFTANQDYFVVRFLAGNVVGLRGFSQNAGQYLTTDIRGQATNLAVDGLDDFALLVVIAERAEDVRNWSEQVAPVAGRPVVYATGFSAAPLAEPYVQSQTGAGLLVGYRDAYTYGVLLDPSLAPPAAPMQEIEQVQPTEVPPTEIPATQVEPTQVPAVEASPTPEGGAPVEASPTIVEPTAVEPSVTVAPTEIPATQAVEATSTPAPSATPRPPTVTPTELPALTGVVDAQQTINVRGGPGTNNPVITTLEPGTVVRVLGRNSDGSWINIQLDDGTEGWVSAELLEIQEPQSSSEKPRVMARVMAQEVTPTPEGEGTVEATAEPITEPGDVQAAAVAGRPYRDERWYGMTLGIVVIVVIIALGSIVNVLRSLFGRRAS